MKPADGGRCAYGGDGAEFSEVAEAKIAKYQADPAMRSLPICMSKTQYSLSDDPAKLGAQRALICISWFAAHLEWLHLTLRSGAPKGFRVNVKDAYVSAGAGFIVVSLGAISFMPGPRAPRTPLRWPLVATCATCQLTRRLPRVAGLPIKPAYYKIGLDLADPTAPRVVGLS